MLIIWLPIPLYIISGHDDPYDGDGHDDSYDGDGHDDPYDGNGHDDTFAVCGYIT